MNYIIGEDDSIYQPYYDSHMMTLKKNGGTFAIIRAGQGASFVDDSLDEHYANAISAGLRTGLYHWIDTQITAKANADFFSRIIDMPAYRDVDTIWGDHEQWWDWITWSQCYEKKLITPSGIVRLAPNKVNDCAAGYFDILRTRYPQKKLGVYTARWFVDGFTPGLNSWSWAKDLYKWYAHYINLGKGVEAMAWDAFKIRVNSLIKPGIPTGWDQDKWDIWQVSSTIDLPGMPRIDLNILHPNSALCPVLGGPVAPVIIPPEPSITDKLQAQIDALSARMTGYESRLHAIEMDHVNKVFIPVSFNTEVKDAE